MKIRKGIGMKKQKSISECIHRTINQSSEKSEDDCKKLSNLCVGHISCTATNIEGSLRMHTSESDKQHLMKIR
jgi:hypothetical protein